MNYTRQYLAGLASKTNFIKDNLEKALSLSKILRFLNNDPDLKAVQIKLINSNNKFA